MTKEQLLTDLINAYKDARQRVRKRSYQLEFETELETSLINLRDEIWERTWKPLPADVFIVFRPVQREVFASQFRDRIVHHLLYNYLINIVDPLFIRDSYSCRKGKGTSDAIMRLKHHLLSATDCYRQKAYILKLDIRGYFMSINKLKLYSIVTRHLDRHWKCAEDRDILDYLLRMVIFNDVTVGCHFRCNKEDWFGLPKNKSLFYAKEGCGLPIGDLTSQLFSNIYLNELDQFVKRTLMCRHYGRYVDDFFIVDRSKEHLLVILQQIDDYISQKLGLTLHPDKTILQHAEWPINFLGQYIRPHYSLPSKRVIYHFKQAIRKIDVIIENIIDSLPMKGKMDSFIYRYILEHGLHHQWQLAVNKKREDFMWLQSSVNSYLGILQHTQSFHLATSVLDNSKAAYCLQFRDNLRKGNIYDWYKYKYKYLID